MADIALIVDTGPLFAAVDRNDRNHEACRELLLDHPGPLLVPIMVIAETTYFIQRSLDHRTEVRLLGDLSAGSLLAEPVVASDWLRMAELVSTNRDLPLGSTDASVIAAAERLGVTDIATLDRRDFSVVRAAHGPLTLLP